MYTPPFTITDDIMVLVADIAQHIGTITALLDETMLTPHLRKTNRIKTIQSSLAIENNSLSVDQVTDILEGKRVLGSPVEIKEVKNAIDAYELMQQLNPYKEKDLLQAHKLMMADLVKENGRYRQGGVGVFNGQQCIHMAPPAQRVPMLMKDLFDWVKKTKTHPLVSSCVFHYEFEFIHPFADGNGRMGRMWQTLLLSQWNPVFAWIPVETIVKENQQQYYDAIAESDRVGNSTTFITFMLKCLLKSIQEIMKSNQKSNQKILKLIQEQPTITISKLAQEVKLSESGVKKILRQLKSDGILRRIGADKGGHWEVVIRN